VCVLRGVQGMPRTDAHLCQGGGGWGVAGVDHSHWSPVVVVVVCQGGGGCWVHSHLVQLQQFVAGSSGCSKLTAHTTAVDLVLSVGCEGWWCGGLLGGKGDHPSACVCAHAWGKAHWV